MRLRAQGHISQESRSAVGRLHSAPATAPVRVVAPAKVARPHRAAGQKARPEGRPLCASYQSGRSGGHADSTTDKLRQGYEEVSSRVKRTAADVDSKFDLSGKAQGAATRLREQARAVESKFGVQHRLRSWSDDFQRQVPQWTRKYQRFSQTTLGQATTTVFVVYLFTSGLAFKLLNVLFILWWLLPLVALPLARRRNQQAAQAAEQRTRGQSSFAEELLRQMRGNNFKTGAGQQRPSWQDSTAGSGKRRDYSNVNDGPVIDAEWTTIDEDK